MSIKAGELRHSITVQQKTQTGTGAHGQPVYTWTTFATVPAKIEPLSGRKLELAKQLVATATHTVTLRYLSGLTAQMRFLYGTRILQIGNVNNTMETGFAMVCTCTEQTSGG